MTKEERRWVWNGAICLIALVAFFLFDGWFGYLCALLIAFVGYLLRIRMSDWFYDDRP